MRVTTVILLALDAAMATSIRTFTDFKCERDASSIQKIRLMGSCIEADNHHSFMVEGDDCMVHLYDGLYRDAAMCGLETYNYTIRATRSVCYPGHLFKSACVVGAGNLEGWGGCAIPGRMRFLEDLMDVSGKIRLSQHQND